VLLAILGAAVSFANLRAEEPLEMAAGEILLKFRETVQVSEKTAFEKEFGLVLLRESTATGVCLYQSKEENVLPIVDRIIKNKNIEFAEPNIVQKEKSIPNDPLYSNQWYLPKIGMPNAWSEFTGTDLIKVAVIDSGVSKYHNEITPILSSDGEWDYVAGDYNADDEGNGGHGTVVAGIIAAVRNNNAGISGVSSNVRIVPFRTSDENGYSFQGDTAAAIERAAEYGCKVINCSFGGTFYSSAQNAAINYANSRGALVVCAAGNESSNNDIIPSYPASFSQANVISVANSITTDALSSFSNFGAVSVDISAPGTDIYSTAAGRRTIDSWSFNSGWEGWSQSIASGSGFFWGSAGLGLFTQTSMWPLLYLPNSTTFLSSPFVDCSNFDKVKVRFGFAGDLSFGDSMGLYTSDLINTWADLGSIFSGNITGDRTYRSAAMDKKVGRLRIFFTSDASWQGYFGLVDADVTGLYASSAAASSAFKNDSGTSFSAPIVAGVAAMLMSQNPSLTHLQVKDIILQTTRKVSALNGKVVSGGIVDAAAALREAKARIAVAPSITSSTSTSGTVGTAFSYTITASSSPSSYNATSLPSGLSVNTSTGVISGTPSSAGTFTSSISASNTAGTGSASLRITISKGAPTIRTGPSASAITYGQTLASSTLNGGSAIVAGNFSWTTPSTAPAVGASSLSVTFTPNDTANYNTATTLVSVMVNKTTPVINTAPTASAITYGQTLASSTLSGGSAIVAGNFSWTTPSTAPAVGASSLSVTFTPNDTANYNTATTLVSVMVNKTTPVINTAPTASAITYGQTLASSTLSGGSASVAGNFAWTTPSANPNLGTSSQGVIFTPNDRTNYNTVTTSVSVTVNQAPPPPTGLVITSDLAAVSVNLGASFSHQITASGSPTSFGAIRLPTGLKLNAKTGLISGRPTQVGTFSATLQALKKGSTTATATKVFTVVQVPTFSYAARINAQRNKTVNVRPKLAGSPAPSFSVVSGSLPPGLSLNASTAAITGIPTATGSYPFTVRGSNSAGNTDRSTTILVK
jgi:subtilisin family serine protease